MSPENAVPKPEERIANAINKAIPLLRKKALRSPWSVALMPVVTLHNKGERGNSLCLTNSGQWLWTTGPGSFDMLDSPGEANSMYAEIKKKQIAPGAFVDALESAVEKLSAIH